MLGNRKLVVEDYWEILKRRKWMILLPAVILPVFALGITFVLTPKYESQTLVLIEEQKVPDDYVKPVISEDLDSRLASMKEQILSRSRIQPITEHYSLYEGKGLTMDERIERVRRDIDIKQIRSDMARGLPGFFIAFTARDARTAQSVCGEITSMFTGENLRSREASAQGTTDFLKGQLADAKHSLDEQDQKLAVFQRQYGGKLPGQQDSNLNMLTSLNTQLETSNQSLARMEQDKTYMESLIAQQAQIAAAHTSTPATVNATPADEAELQTLLTEQADLTARYTADYPDVVIVKKKIADLRAKMAQHPTTSKGTGQTTASGEPIAIQQLRAQLRAADIGIQAKRKEQADIENSIRTYQDRISSSPLVEAQYKDLTRDYETAQKFYDDLLAKMNQSKMATDLERRQQGEQFRVMDAPNLPEEPKFPNRAIFFLGGLAGGLAFGIAIAALLEYKDTAIRSERDIAALTKLPTIALIGLSGFDESSDSGKKKKPRGPRSFFKETKGMQVTEVH